MDTDNNMQQSMDIAEESRQKEWKLPSFASELFQGRFKWDMISPFPEQQEEDRKIGDRFLGELRACLVKYINPEEVDSREELPFEARQALVKIGAFRMKIPKKYGGLGLSNMNYSRAISLVASYCSSTAVWLSAHQSIGVPQPLKLYGTDDQKKKFFNKIVDGAISAFALTEPDVGSDPAQMRTRADMSEDGTYYLLNGTKQWCTNGPDADYIVVMALTKPKIVRGKEKKQISAFIINMDSPGVHVANRCHFMGIRGISNGIIRFENVRVPVENLLGEEGQGLRIALETLNSGRLIIPACSAAIGKYSMNVCRQWASDRVQWGYPIGKHQAVASMLTDITCETYAMESISLLATGLSDQNKYDIRLEAAMAKYYGSESAWQVIDKALQIRGGRGYETATSLKERGEEAIPIERIMRDIRINRIIEGSSEIMRLFIAREAVDPHIKLVMPLLKRGSATTKLKATLKMLAFYAKWYPTLWIPSIGGIRTKNINNKNKKHLRFIRRTCRIMSRKLFHKIVAHQMHLQEEQIILGHFVDVAVLLYAMSAGLARTESILIKTDNARELQELNDLFCQKARNEIKQHFRALRTENRNGIAKISKNLLLGKYTWMEKGILTSTEASFYKEKTEERTNNIDKEKVGLDYKS